MKVAGWTAAALIASLAGVGAQPPAGQRTANYAIQVIWDCNGDGVIDAWASDLYRAPGITGAACSAVPLASFLADPTCGRRPVPSAARMVAELLAKGRAACSASCPLPGAALDPTEVSGSLRGIALDAYGDLLEALSDSDLEDRLRGIIVQTSTLNDVRLPLSDDDFANVWVPTVDEIREATEQLEPLFTRFDAGAQEAGLLHDQTEEVIGSLGDLMVSCGLGAVPAEPASTGDTASRVEEIRTLMQELNGHLEAGSAPIADSTDATIFAARRRISEALRVATELVQLLDPGAP